MGNRISHDGCLKASPVNLNLLQTASEYCVYLALEY